MKLHRKSNRGSVTGRQLRSTGRSDWSIALAFVGFAWIGSPMASVAQEPVRALPLEIVTERFSFEGAVASQKRHLFLFCGLPGDARHRDLMTNACRDIIESCDSVLGVSKERLHVLAGDEEMQDALQDLHAAVEICDRETVRETLETRASKLPREDAFWMIVIGHGHPYGAVSQWNVAGKDIDQRDVGSWTSGIGCAEQVIWLTQPISGFWLKPLAKPGRTVITATEADLEFTGTEMPYALGAVLAGKAESQDLQDIDGDGTLSLLDLYLATSLEVTGRFRGIDRLQTEHSQLDDNGDGRGSEVQQPYLPEEEPDEEDENPDEESEDDDEDAESGEDAEDAEGDEAAVDVADPEDGSAVIASRPPLIQSTNLDGFRSRFVLLAGLPASADPESIESDPVGAAPSTEGDDSAPSAESGSPPENPGTSEDAK